MKLVVCTQSGGLFNSMSLEHCPQGEAIHHRGCRITTDHTLDGTVVLELHDTTLNGVYLFSGAELTELTLVNPITLGQLGYLTSRIKGASGNV